MTGQRSAVARGSGPVTGGKGWPFGSPLNVAKYGCVLEEFLIEGVAQSYEPAPGTTIGLDGKWSVKPADTAEYRTRMYVVRPSDPARFNGVVVVNWQNVTAGVDLGAPSPHEMRNGYAWVGVTTQRVAIEGQPSLTPGMADTKGLPAAPIPTGTQACAIPATGTATTSSPRPPVLSVPAGPSLRPTR
jgi:hypothetical protein